MSKITRIRISLIDPPSEDIRSSRDLDYIERLAASIREMGLLHPIRVRKVGDRYETITGATRRIACIAAGCEEVDAIIVEGELSDSDLIIEKFCENSFSSPQSSLERAAVYQRLLALNPGWTQNDVAKHCHVAPASVSKDLTVSRNLLPALHDDVMAGVLQASCGYEISKAPPEMQLELAERLKQGKLTRDSLAVEVSRINGKKPKNGKPQMVNGKTKSGIVYSIPATMSMDQFFAELEAMFQLAKSMLKEGRALHSFPYLLD